MSSLLNRYLPKINFESYEDFKDNFKITVPDNFNFAFDVVDVYAEEFPDKVAIVWCNDSGEENIITFKDLSYLSNMAANLFQKLGVRKGDAVMLILKSRIEFWISIVALHKIGAIAIPSVHILNKKEIVYRMRSADIRMIISVGDVVILKKVDAAASELGDTALVKVLVGKPGQSRDGWINFRRELEKSSSDFTRPTGPILTKNKDILLAYFTSATSDIPKFVKHDHLYPLSHIITAKYWQSVVEDGLHYTIAETGWAKSMWGSIYGQWIAGSAVFVYDYNRFDTSKMLEKMAIYGVTTFSAPPSIYGSMLKKDLSKFDLSNLKYVVSAGEPMTPVIYKQFLKKTGLKIMEGYGQTETPLIIANYPWIKLKQGSMGKPSPGYEIILIDENDRICEIGGEGEIVIKTDEGKPIGLSVNYSLETIGPNRRWHDDYYHTGDIAWMDEDGYFWFVGRSEDVIKSSGYRIGPFEVENALLSHPAVVECAVTGIPDPIKGAIVKATVVLAEGYSPTEELKSELQSHVKSEIAPYKYPRIIEFSAELPKTISGKIRRIEIRDKDKPYPVINALECKACERCILACPVNVLELGSDINERGYRFVVYVGDDCIGCGNCYYTCPEPHAIEVHIFRKDAS